MANRTFTQIYFHVVFGTRFRKELIPTNFQPELNKYIFGVISKRGHRCFIVNGVSDHIHLFLSFNQNDQLPELVREVKRTSSNFIREKIRNKRFRWQNGYGAFSVNHQGIERVYNYIENQQIRHKEKTYFQEYDEFLTECGVEDKRDYLIGFDD
ncbi:MAG: putative transposase [Flavobacteriales bacterium]|jgi:putative transposase